MFEFDMLQSCMVIALLVIVGEIVSRWMKAAVPSILIAGLIFIAGMWSGILPADLADLSGLTTMTSVGIMMVIVHMGSTTNLKELAANWRVVFLAAVSFFGQLALLFLVIGSIYGMNIAVGSLPGGMTTALIVQERARLFGYEHIVVLSMLIWSVQGVVACPLVSFFLKKEVKRLQANGLVQYVEETKGSEKAKVEKPAESHYWPLLRLLVVAWLCSRIEILTGFPKYVLCLLLGVVFTEIGFLRKNEMDGTKSQGFIFFMMMAMVMAGYGAFTPEMFLQMLVPLLSVFACEVVSIILICGFLGPKLGFSRPMGISIGLNVMVGFPVNLMISEDVINFLVKEENERKALLSQISTKMVLGGFTSVTFLATIAAGFLVVLMH
ncbi:MAG: hypothetical protein IKU83_02465 [Lachnospiraceae bacterium]|nr:hypothetical protein [Lachnospiraceae bacterium]